MTAMTTAPDLPAQASGEVARLRGRWLTLARAGWIAVALSQAALSVVGLSAWNAALQTVCTASPCADWQVTPATVQGLAHWGISLGAFAFWAVVLQALYTAVFYAVAALIFWRKSDDGLALFVSLSLLLVGTLSPSSRAALADHQVWYAFAQFAASMGWASLFTVFFCLFPDGRFVPRWAALVAVGNYLINVPSALPGLFSNTPFDSDAWPVTGVALVELLLFGSGAVAQIYRYRRVSGPVEREQTKWVVVALMAATAGGITPDIVAAVVPSLSSSTYASALYSPLSSAVTGLSFVLLPIGVGIAILRSHLWDIDIIIRRTLVYGSLTLILAALYFALVIGAQRLTQVFTGQQVGQQPVVIVLSTLLIAALFTPLRARLQRWIDRRFYRSRYDAAKTVAAFSASLRSEVDLAQLDERLLAVVDETLRPAHASLWLRAASGARLSASTSTSATE